MESIQEILSQIEFHTGLDLIKLGQQVKAYGGLSIFGTDIWFPDGTASRPLSVDTNKKISFAGAAGTPITGSGTINTIPKFTAATVIGDSRVTDDGATLQLAELQVTAGYITGETSSLNFPAISGGTSRSHIGQTDNGTYGKLVFGAARLSGSGDTLFALSGDQGATQSPIQIGVVDSSTIEAGILIRKPTMAAIFPTFSIEAIAGQTSDLQRWLNSSGSTLAKVDITGVGTFANSIISGLTADTMIYSNASKQITSTGAPTNGQLLTGSTGAAPVLAVPLGTTNQITVAAGAGTLTFSTPQNIHSAATPTFAGLTLNGNESVTGNIKTGDFAGTLDDGDIGVKRTGNTFGVTYLGSGNYVISGGATFGAIQLGAGGTYKFYVTDNGNIVCGSQAALATNATDGFLYIPTCAGTPTGVPTAYTGKSAMVYDTTNFVLYVYAGGAWRTH